MCLLPSAAENRNCYNTLTLTHEVVRYALCSYARTHRKVRYVSDGRGSIKTPQSKLNLFNLSSKKDETN